MDSVTGKIGLVQTSPTLPTDFTGEAHCAEIKVRRRRHTAAASSSCGGGGGGCGGVVVVVVVGGGGGGGGGVVGGGGAAAAAFQLNSLTGTHLWVDGDRARIEEMINPV